MNWKKTPDHPMRRDTDTMSLLSRLLTSRPLWYGLAAFMVVLGFDFRTPASHFNELEKFNQTVDLRISVLTARQDSVEKTQESLEKYIRALSIAQCIDRPRRETQLMGIPCSQLMRGQNQ